MTLTEFLLARIAEDEAIAAKANKGGDVEDTPIFECGSQGRHVGMAPVRVLAECEAKRRIVERCSAVDSAMPSTHLAHGILAELALPYADHPDYDESWGI